MRAAVRRQFDVESPAEVRVRFTNLAAAERAFWFGTVVPFLPRDVRHTELDARLQLVSRGGAGGVDTDGDGTIETLPDGPTGSCWQADDAVVFSEELRLVRLDGCETVAETFAVVAHPGNERCMPDGRYRAESSWATDDDRGGTSQAVTVEWGFTIEISSG